MGHLSWWEITGIIIIVGWVIIVTISNLIDAHLRHIQVELTNIKNELDELKEKVDDLENRFDEDEIYEVDE